MNESDYKTAIVKQARQLRVYARRIEDKYQVGFPDLILRPQGWAPVFIEAKITDGRSYAPSPRQLVDLRQLHEPPNSYAAVLGILPRPAERNPLHRVTYYLAPPEETIFTNGPDVSVGNNFFDVLKLYLEKHGAR